MDISFHSNEKVKKYSLGNTSKKTIMCLKILDFGLPVLMLIFKRLKKKKKTMALKGESETKYAHNLLIQ